MFSKIDNNLSISNIESNQNYNSNSLTPLQLIQWVFSFHLEEFGQKVYKKFNIERDIKEFRTDCVDIRRGLSLLFCNEKKAKKINRKLSKCFQYQFYTPLSNGEKFIINVKGLCDGLVIRSMHTDPIYGTLSKAKKKEKALEFLISNAAPFLDHYNLSLENITNGSTPTPLDIVRVCNEMTFSFNSTLLNAIKDDIFSNSFLVDDQTSYIYFMQIDCINLQGTLHAWVLEQFYCSQKKQTFYHLYQSWINQTTLLNDIQEKNYGYFNENAWDGKRAEQFLNQLTDFCCNRDIQKRISSKECFGYLSSPLPLTAFDGFNFAGLVLKCWVEKVNPLDCEKNFQSFFNATSPL